MSENCQEWWLLTSAQLPASLSISWQRVQNDANFSTRISLKTVLCIKGKQHKSFKEDTRQQRFSRPDITVLAGDATIRIVQHLLWAEGMLLRHKAALQKGVTAGPVWALKQAGLCRHHQPALKKLLPVQLQFLIYRLPWMPPPGCAWELCTYLLCKTLHLPQRICNLTSRHHTVMKQMEETQVLARPANGIEYNSAIRVCIAHKTLQWDIVVFLRTRHGTVS